jgi:hypothetical protein
MYGVASLAGSRVLEMIPEADRVHESRIFHSTVPMFVTSEDLSMTSDIAVWRGIRYRVLSVRDYDQRGYYSAIGVRMAGQ